LTSYNLLQKHSVLVAFTGRQGGVSPFPYHSLNLAFPVGDNSANVIENRKRVCQVLNLNPSSVTTAEQVHSNNVFLVDKEYIGQGAFSSETALPGADALVANLSRVPLVLFFADCLPIALVDPVKRVVAIIHAGRRGTSAKIVSKTLSLFEQNFQSRNSDVLVFMGPSIDSCCYEIGEELVSELKLDFSSCLIRTGSRWYFDLKKANYEQLLHQGILPDNIYAATSCTSCRSDLFFSYRKENGRTGRQAGIVALL
jgi:YfiH family protein